MTPHEAGRGGGYRLTITKLLGVSEGGCSTKIGSEPQAKRAAGGHKGTSALRMEFFLSVGTRRESCRLTCAVCVLLHVTLCQLLFPDPSTGISQCITQRCEDVFDTIHCLSTMRAFILSPAHFDLADAESFVRDHSRLVQQHDDSH